MIAERIIKSAERTPLKTAIVSEGRNITYKKLVKLIEGAAVYIEKLLLIEKEPVGICMPNCLEFVVFLCACELTNHTAVLLSTSFKKEEIYYHIENAGLNTIITKESVSRLMNEAGFNFRCMEETVFVWDTGKKKSEYDYLKGDYICQLTSGTDGKAKGIIRTGEAVLLEVIETVETVGFTSEDIFLTIPPICHSFGLVAGTLLPLCEGATVIFLKTFSVIGVFEAIEKRKVTTLFAVPFMYQLMIQNEVHIKSKFNSLKNCISAGAKLPKDTEDRFYELTGNKIMQDYGSTETGVMSFNKALENDSVGRAVGSREFMVIDGNGEEVSSNIKGILLTKSRCNLRCYLYPKELNKNIEDGWLKLGDIGYIDEEENLYVSGRESGFINVGGMKVDPVEVEKILLQIPQIKEAVVVGNPAMPYGEIVKAVIVKSGEINNHDIVHYCKGKISDYKIPKIIEYMDEIPRSQTGKIQKKYLVN